MKSNLKFGMAAIACLLSLGVMTSCGDDKGKDEPDAPVVTPESGDKPEGGNSLTYFFAKGNSFSAAQFKGVTLAEIHSDVSDYTMTCNAPEGYVIRLVKLSNKDGAGFTVYRIVCDMDENFNQSADNANKQYEVAYSLSGSGYRDGKKTTIEYNNSVNWQRFDAPESKPKSLFKEWYLAEYSVDSNLDWVNFSTRYKYSETKVEPRDYSQSISPISIIGITTSVGPDASGNYSYYYTLAANCKGDFSGWKTGLHDLLNIVSGSRLVYPDEDVNFGNSIYFINDNMLRTMKAEYSLQGELVKIHRYKFLPA